MHQLAASLASRCHQLVAYGRRHLTTVVAISVCCCSNVVRFQRNAAQTLVSASLQRLEVQSQQFAHDTPSHNVAKQTTVCGRGVKWGTRVTMSTWACGGKASVGTWSHCSPLPCISVRTADTRSASLGRHVHCKDINARGQQDQHTRRSTPIRT